MREVWAAILLWHFKQTESFAARPHGVELAHKTVRTIQTQEEKGSRATREQIPKSAENPLDLM